MSDQPSRRRHAQLTAIVSSVLIVGIVTPVVQGIYGDPATQLKAVQQRIAGESPSINISVSPDTADVSKDASEWISWWTPGTPLVVYPVMRAGLSMGQAVRAVAAVALIVGSIGWATWFSYFELPDTVLLALAALFPWVRHASNGVFLYSSEVLVFAAGPWLLAATMTFLSGLREPRSGYVRHFLLGLMLGSGYWLKDSLAFVALGSTIALVIGVWRARTDDRLTRLTGCAVTAAGAAVPFAALVALNRAFGSTATKLTAVPTFAVPSWKTLVDVVSLPALQMGDAYSLWDYLLRHPSHPVIQDGIWIGLVGLPGGAVLWWLCHRPRVTRPEGLLARSLLASSLACMLMIWTFSAAVDDAPRHVATAAFAMLPLAVAEAFKRWGTLSGRARLVLASAGVFYICVPFAYGALSVAAKVRRFPSPYRPGPSRLYNPFLSEHDVASVSERLLQHNAPDTIWYIPDPLSPLDLPGRAIVTTADRQALDELRLARYVSSRRLRVQALLSMTLERAGKGAIIRGSFPQAGPWSSVEIPGSDYWLWTAELYP